MSTPLPDGSGDTPVPTTELEANATAATGSDPAPQAEAAAEPEATKSTVSDAEYNAMGDVLTFIYDYRTPEGHDPSKLFHKRVNKRFLPDYYEVIKEPQAMSDIKRKVNSRSYASFQDYIRDWALICHNAQVYNRPDAGAYHDALTIKALVEVELKKLVDSGLITAEVAALPYLGEIPHYDDVPAEEGAEEEESSESEEEEEEGVKKRGRGRPRKGEEKTEAERIAEIEARKKRGRPPKVDTPMEARIKNILKGLRRSKNAAGEFKIISFDRLPDKVIMPGYYLEITNPVAVDVLKKKLKRKKYSSVEQFMQDVELMFENAKRFNEDDSQIYKDAVDLQLEARKLAAEEQSKPDTDFAMEDGRIPLPDGIFHNGELYKPGDWVHIQNANDLTKPIVTQIYRTWQDSSAQKFVNVCWYYRPEQTVHRFDKHFYEHEVVKTGQYRDHSIEEIVDRCFVMFITRYNKGRPRGYPSEKEIYVCESRYNEEKLTFNKIKTWASCLPDEVRDKDYEMELFSEPKRLKKQPSPIAYLLKDEAKETDELPKPEWGADNAPPKIGAVHRRPRDPRDSPPPAPTPSPPPEPTPPPPQPVRQMSTTVSQPLQQFRAQAANMAASTPSRQTPGASSTPQPQTQFANASQLQQQPSASPAPGSHRPLAPNRGSSFNTTTSQTPQLSGPNLAPAAQNNSNNYSNANASATLSTYANNLAALSNNIPASTSTNTNMQNLPRTSSNIPPYTPSYLSNPTAYKAPQPIEVWSLNDAANASIPPDIRSQFQRDEAGRVLFFTAPPVDLADEDAQDAVGVGGEVLGHSVEYLAWKVRRTEELAERKRKREDARVERVEKRRKEEAEARRVFQAKREKLMGRAMEAWKREMEGEV